MMTSKLLIVAVIGAIMISSTFAKEENHVGYSLIKNLQLEALNIINELEDQWKTQRALLQRGIDSWENTVNQQTSLCESRAGDLAKTDKDIETTEAYIAWITNKIAENNARVQTLEEWRCTANTLYVNGIKNNKLTLSLIEYLYKELSSAKNLEMLQKMHVMTKLTVFIEAYKLGNVAALLDAPVFAQFKSHLKQEDGESDEPDTFENEDEETLDEIEDELNESEDGDDESEGGSEGGSHSSGSYNDSNEDDESSSGADGEEGDASHEDGEWEDEDEDDEEDDEEEFEDDEEEEEDEGTEAAGDHHDAEDEDDEESGETVHRTGSSHHASGDDEEEDSEESGSRHGSGHHFEGGSHSKGGEQTGATHAWTHTEWDVDTSSWPQFKKDLLDILVRLRNSIIHKMRQAQDDEVNAGIALADYKVIIHRENEDLERALANQKNRLEDLLVLQTKQQIKVTECQAELSTVTDSLYASKSELENSEAQFNENRKAAIDERDIYDYVVSLYEGKVEERFRFKGDNRSSRQLDNISF